MAVNRGTLCGPATRNHLHLGGFAAESGKSLPRLNADEHLHCFAKQVGLVRPRIGDLKRSVIEFIINGDGGSQGAGPRASIVMYYSIN